MCEIYTSYFSNINNIKNCHANSIFISIARYPPASKVLIHSYLTLAPSSQLLHLYKEGIVNKDIYTKMYLNDLEKFNPKSIYEEILEFKIDSDYKIFLLCYEKPGDFCHRHLAANWLNLNLELGSENYIKEYSNTINQKSLFS